MNSKIITEIENQNYEEITNQITKFLENQLEETKAEGFVLGLSGGIDSAVLAYLCNRKFKEKTLAIIMPDSEITPQYETDDALTMINLTKIGHKLIDINPILKEYSNHLEANEWAEGNLRARIRTNILYYYANAKNYLVLGSSDKSEHLIGYFTKFGDGAADIVPIISLYKLQVRKIAEFLGVPKNVIEKKSSAHLWKHHEAEKEIGVSYEEIDSILFCIFDKKLSIENTSNETQIEKSKVEKVYNLYLNSKHKRLPAQKPQRD